MISASREINGESVIITFHPHPRKIISSGSQEVQLITTIEERIELLRKAGIDHVVIVPFTSEFSMLSPEDYIEDFLIKNFHPHTIIIGYDHRFGHQRSGDYHLLEKYSNKGFFELKEISEEVINNNIVSSTNIRKALLSGNIEEANRLLGYSFFFSGIVIKGDQLGRTLGFPTANVRVSSESKIIPANGVYAVNIRTGKDSTEYKGMMNIGTRPTLEGKDRRIEVNIFDFNREIYGEEMHISIAAFIRSEQKFSGLESLTEQLKKDRVTALSSLS